MRSFVLKANAEIQDIITGEIHPRNSLFEITQEERVKDMVGKRHVATLKQIKCGIKKSGNKILVAHNFMAIIGGVERAELNLAKQFKDRDITFLFKQYALEPVLELSKYCDVIIDEPDEEYETDVLIMANFETDTAMVKRVKSRKTYQQIHADWQGLKEFTEWKGYQWQPDKRVDKVLAVSETAAKGLQTAFKSPIDSIVVRNVFLEEKPPKTLFFLTLSRLSKEKGAMRTLQMIQKLEEAGKSFVWFFASTPSHEGIEEKLRDKANIVFIKPSIKNTSLIPKVDYLVQLSDNESYGFSVREALFNHTPVIVTKIPEFEKIVKDRQNGFILEKDLSNLDIEALYKTDFSNMPEFKEELDPKWERVLSGTIDEPDEVVSPKREKKAPTKNKSSGKKSQKGKK